MDSTIISLAPMEGMTGFVVRNAFCHKLPGDYKKRIKDFHDEVYDGLNAIFTGEADVVMHMKSIWQYLKEEYPEAGSDIKKLIKAKKPAEYKAIARGILA